MEDKLDTSDGTGKDMEAKPILGVIEGVDSSTHNVLGNLEEDSGGIAGWSEPKLYRRIYFKYSESGEEVYLSGTEWSIAEWYIRLGGVGLVKREFEREWGKGVDMGKVRGVLDTERVCKYILERLKDEGIYNVYEGENGKKRWLREMMDMRDGRMDVDEDKVRIMQLVGKFMYGE